MNIYKFGYYAIFFILGNINLLAQPIISYTEDTKDGFAMTYSLHEEQVLQIFSVYKEIKQKDSEMDVFVFETFRMGMIAFFKKNPQKASKLLRELKFASPSAKLLVALLRKKEDKANRKVKIDTYSRQLVDNVVTTIVQEKITRKESLGSYK